MNWAETNSSIVYGAKLRRKQAIGYAKHLHDEAVRHALFGPRLYTAKNARFARHFADQHRDADHDLVREAVAPWARDGDPLPRELVAEIARRANVSCSTVRGIFDLQRARRTA